MEFKQQFEKVGKKKVPVKEWTYKFNLEGYSPEEAAKLKKMAIERFAKDETAQLEYAVVSILKEAVDTLSVEKITEMAKKDKGVKNGNKNNSRQ